MGQATRMVKKNRTSILSNMLRTYGQPGGNDNGSGTQASYQQCGDPQQHGGVKRCARQIQGNHGMITLLKANRPLSAADEDIHTLIARILLMKTKRERALASTQG